MEIRKLNSLRGFAALMVVVSHFSNSTKWLGGLLGGSGQYGVMIFFILSGFLMSYLYLDLRCNSKNLKKYFVARFARVVPLFLIILIYSYMLQSNGIRGYSFTITDSHLLVSHLLLLSGISALWTIPAEIHFYLIFALLWLFSNKIKGYIYFIMMGIFIISFFMRFHVFTGEINGIPYEVKLLQTLPFFFMGVALGRLYKVWKVPKYLRSNWFLLTLIIIPLLYPKIFILLTGYKYRFWLDSEILILVSFVFFCIVFLVPDKNPLLANKVGDFFGKISYSLYLWHLPILMQARRYFRDQHEIQLLVFILVTILVSYASYRIIEMPSNRMFKRLLK